MRVHTSDLMQAKGNEVVTAELCSLNNQVRIDTVMDVPRGVSMTVTTLVECWLVKIIVL